MSLEIARTLLNKSKFPVVLTGAGISSESGIPTFRGEEGLWKNFRAEELATPGAFFRNPDLVWEWYNWRRSLILDKKPNAGHIALAKYQEKNKNFPIVTQNVDNLHNLSGAIDVIEMHGNIFKSRCLKCNDIVFDTNTDNNAPECRKCGGKMRPHVVWFGEALETAVMRKISELLGNCDLLFVIGTSGNVYPAAGFAGQVFDNGGSVVEINPEPVLSFATRLTGKSGEILPELLG